MKKLFLLTCALLSLNAMAQSNNSNDSLWTGILWKNGEKPIVLPIQFKTKNDCQKMLNDTNDITSSTINVTRDVLCQEILPQVKN